MVRARNLIAAAQVDWKPPAQPWIMRQTWRELLFAHWPLPIAAFTDRLPPGLALDTFDGQARIGLVPFVMSGVRPRDLPPVAGLSRFAELNVRTYVTRDGKPGVWFYSLDASNPIAVAIARAVYHLDYFNARFRIAHQGKAIHYHATRTDDRIAPAEFDLTYAPIGAVFHAVPGTLAHWLTERYALYAADARGHLYRGEIRHPAWPLQLASATIHTNTLEASHGFTLPDTPPLLYYAHQQEMVAWNIARLT